MRPVIERGITLTRREESHATGKSRPIISIVQPRPANQLPQLFDCVKKAHSEGVDLILFPEGYLPSYEDNETLSLEDKTIGSLKHLTIEYDIVIATGIKEKLKHRRFLSLVVFGEGDIVAVHRKVILAHFEKGFFSAKRLRVDAEDVFPVARIHGIGNVGCLLCYENLFPETHRLLRYKGAEIILGPSGFGMKGEGFDYRESWLCELRSRSIENKTYILSATNAIGSGLMGAVIDPTGRVILDLDREGQTSCPIDMEFLRKWRKNVGTEKETDELTLRVNINEIPSLFYKMLFSESQSFRRRFPIDE